MTGDEPLGDVLVNLAHLYTAAGPLQNLANAAKLYEQVLKKHGLDKEVLLCLCHAYYLSGSLDLCKKHLMVGAHMWPLDERLWYNLALAQEEAAIQGECFLNFRFLAHFQDGEFPLYTFNVRESVLAKEGGTRSAPNVQNRPEVQ